MLLSNLFILQHLLNNIISELEVRLKQKGNLLSYLAEDIFVVTVDLVGYLIEEEEGFVGIAGTFEVEIEELMGVAEERLYGY